MEELRITAKSPLTLPDAGRFSKVSSECLGVGLQASSLFFLCV